MAKLPGAPLEEAIRGRAESSRAPFVGGAPQRELRGRWAARDRDRGCSGARQERALSRPREAAAATPFDALGMEHRHRHPGHRLHEQPRECCSSRHRTTCDWSESHTWSARRPRPRRRCSWRSTASTPRCWPGSEDGGGFGRLGLRPRLAIRSLTRLPLAHLQRDLRCLLVRSQGNRHVDP